MVLLVVELAPLVGADLDAGAGYAVVAALKAHDASLLGVDLGHLHGQVIGLGARVGEGNNAQLGREPLEQLAGGFQDLVVQEPGVGDQLVELLLHFGNVVGMAVTDVRHIVNAVQSLAAVLLEEELPPSYLDPHWVRPVRYRHHGVQVLGPLKNYLLNHLLVGG